MILFTGTTAFWGSSCAFLLLDSTLEHAKGNTKEAQDGTNPGQDPAVNARRQPEPQLSFTGGREVHPLRVPTQQYAEGLHTLVIVHIEMQRVADGPLLQEATKRHKLHVIDLP